MKKIIPCGHCAWCVSCTQRIDITAVFDLWNRFAVSGDERAFLSGYDSLDVTPDRCIRCRQCGLLCARSIEIPKKLAEIAETAAQLKDLQINKNSV